MTTDGRQVAATIGRVGVWSSSLERNPGAVERAAVEELEALGYRAVWFPEGRRSKESLSHAALLLAASSRIVVATGIANIWFRDPTAMATGARSLAEAYPGRFLLGIGVSHAPTVEQRLGLPYERPLTRMAEYLAGMDAAPDPPNGSQEPPRVLAALGPAMLRLAAERSAGAHTYFVPVEHTARAREILGPGPLLAPQQAAVLESDQGVARSIAGEYADYYLRLPNYTNNLRRLGWEEEDVSGPSDRLLDAIVAWGDAEAIARRVHEHLDAGADHVSVQILRRNPAEIPLEEYRELALALLS